MAAKSSIDVRYTFDLDRRRRRRGRRLRAPRRGCRSTAAPGRRRPRRSTQRAGGRVDRGLAGEEHVVSAKRWPGSTARRPQERRRSRSACAARGESTGSRGGRPAAAATDRPSACEGQARSRNGSRRGAARAARPRRDRSRPRLRATQTASATSAAARSGKPAAARRAALPATIAVSAMPGQTALIEIPPASGAAPRCARSRRRRASSPRTTGSSGIAVRPASEAVATMRPPRASPAPAG